jgi:EmrB/QacA subfamily drug resistance transporter
VTDLKGKTEPNRWAVLALLGVAQLMVTLDVTIVNIALPTAQQTLHFSTDQRQWVITAYALSFGSLLLLGGKLGDVFGRKWTFIGGLIGFALASALGGMAGSFGTLVAARALQGVFAALLAPTALSLLAVAFQDSPDRPKALGIFGAIAAAGASLGLLLGGVITELLNWRWCLFVNLFIAVPAALVALHLIRNVRPQTRPRIDFPGVLVASAGLFSLVYGLSSAETHSWSAPVTIVALIANAVLLSAFVVLENHVANPLLPLHIVWNRVRAGSYATMFIIGSGIFAQYLFLSFYMQKDLGFSPIETGLGFLPFTVTVAFTSIRAQKTILPRIGVKWLIMIGSALAVVGQVLFTRLSPHGNYASEIVPSLILTGLGVGCLFSSAIFGGTVSVKPGDAGIAGALVNTSLQIGGSVGTTVLSLVFASSVAGYEASHAASKSLAQDAAIHGYTAAFWWAAGLFALGVLVATFIIPKRTATPVSQPTAPGPQRHTPAFAAEAADVVDDS